MDRIIDYPSSACHAGELPPELECTDVDGKEPLSRIRLLDGQIAWLVTRYQDVQAVLAGDSFTRDIAAARSQTGARPRTVNMDGRPHLELRSLVARAFTGGRIGALAPYVQELADSLLDSLELGGSPGDLVSGFAAPLPAIVICRLLGFPADDSAALSRWCDRITAVGDQETVQSAWLELGGYVDGAVQSRHAALEGRSAPDEDLLTTLARAEADGKLTREELISLAIVILAGGLETTETAISAGLVRMLSNPDQFAMLRADLGLLDTAVEEMLRRQPVINLNRVQIATADVWLGEQFVAAGDLVQISINSANRDDEVFRESARFDIARQPNPHLAFGYGAHHCLGAALARLELRTAFSTILRRFPGIELAVAPDRLRWRDGHFTISLAELPVTW